MKLISLIFFNMLISSKNSKTCKRFVYAASSSTYGDSLALPKVEGNEGKPMSPYAVTKQLMKCMQMYLVEFMTFM